jgi:hypothetical protein
MNTLSQFEGGHLAHFGQPQRERNNQIADPDDVCSPHATAKNW